MALDQTELRGYLEDIFTYDYRDQYGAVLFSYEAGLDSAVDAANAWANAYYRYCLGAEANAGAFVVDVAVMAPKESLLAVELSALFALYGTDPATFASQFATALLNFWFTPPITMSGSPIASVTGVPVLVPLLTAYWSTTTTDNLIAAADHADMFHNGFTNTALIQVTNPSGTPPTFPVY